MLWPSLLWAGGPQSGVTRWYFSTATAPVNTKYGGGTAEWNDTSTGTSRRKLSTYRDNGGGGTSATKTSTGTNPEAHLVIQAVGPPLAAQTISGNIKGQFKCAESAAQGNYTIAVRIFVVSNDGSTVRGTLLSISASDNTAATPPEFATTATNRQLQDVAEATSIALSSLAIQEGDRLVIEIGAIDRDAGSRTCTISFGNVSNTTDLPEDNTSTAFSCPWVEFNSDIELACDPGPNNGDTTAGQWASMTNVQSSDNLRAIEVTVNDTMANWQPGFKPDATVTIDGILLEAEGQLIENPFTAGGSAGSLDIRLSWNGGVNWTAAKSATYTEGEPEAYKSFGGAADTWGRSWTASEFSNANFRVSLKYATEGISQDQIEIDHVRATLYCSAAAGTGNIRRQRILR